MGGQENIKQHFYTPTITPTTQSKPDHNSIICLLVNLPFEIELVKKNIHNSKTVVWIKPDATRIVVWIKPDADPYRFLYFGTQFVGGLPNVVLYHPMRWTSIGLTCTIPNRKANQRPRTLEVLIKSPRRHESPRTTFTLRRSSPARNAAAYPRGRVVSYQPSARPRGCAAVVPTVASPGVCALAVQTRRRVKRDVVTSVRVYMTPGGGRAVIGHASTGSG